MKYKVYEKLGNEVFRAGYVTATKKQIAERMARDKLRRWKATRKARGYDSKYIKTSKQIKFVKVVPMNKKRRRRTFGFSGIRL